MIKLENVVLASPEQMKFIIQGMRNPMNSWEKSDSDTDPDFYSLANIEIGSDDHSLMQRLSNAGTEHRKYMRMMGTKDSINFLIRFSLFASFPGSISKKESL